MEEKRERVWNGRGIFDTDGLKRKNLTRKIEDLKPKTCIRTGGIRMEERCVETEEGKLKTEGKSLKRKFHGARRKSITSQSEAQRYSDQTRTKKNQRTSAQRCGAIKQQQRCCRSRGASSWAIRKHWSWCGRRRGCSFRPGRSGCRWHRYLLKTMDWDSSSVGLERKPSWTYSPIDRDREGTESMRAPHVLPPPDSPAAIVLGARTPCSTKQPGMAGTPTLSLVGSGWGQADAQSQHSLFVGLQPSMRKTSLKDRQLLAFGAWACQLSQHHAPIVRFDTRSNLRQKIVNLPPRSL